MGCTYSGKDGQSVVMPGNTTVCKWKDNKTAAFCISGDDTLHSHLDFFIPEMKKRGFRSTFWINPACETINKKGFCWNQRNEEWLAAAKDGFDFANHSMHHSSLNKLDEAEYEIGECSRIIWESNPGQKLQLFLQGGGTVWNIAYDILSELLDKYLCVQGRGGGIINPCWHRYTRQSATAEELKGYVDEALAYGSWHLIACHGTGNNAEWLPTDAEPLIAVMDYLVEKKDKVWVGTNTQIHKYDRERSSAYISTLEIADTRIRLNLHCAEDKTLYDYPLTLRTRVPSDWRCCLVAQGSIVKEYAVNASIVKYEALPGNGEILLKLIC